MARREGYSDARHVAEAPIRYAVTAEALVFRAMTKVRSLLAPLLTIERAIDGATLAASLVITDQLYVFHRFTLEALAFLATWYVLRAAVRFFTLKSR